MDSTRRDQRGWGGRDLAKGSCDHDASMGFVAFEVVTQARIEEDFAEVAGGAGVHEAEHAVFAVGEADMRGGEGIAIAANDADDIAVLKLGFGFGDGAERDHEKGAAAQASFELGDAGTVCGAIDHVAVSLPSDGHFSGCVTDRATAEGAGEVFDETAFFIVSSPVLKVVKTGEVAAVALPIPVAVLFDQVE